MQTLYTVQHDDHRFWLDVEQPDGLPYQDDLFEKADLFIKNNCFWVETKTKPQRKFRSACISAKSPLALLDNVSCFLDSHKDVKICSDDYVIIFYK